MDENEVELFLQTVKHQSLRRAAKGFGMTVPTLNHKLRSLERDLGIVLLDRTPRGIRLTREGETFMALAPQLIDVSNEIRGALKEVRPNRQLWIAATPDLASLILSQFLAYLSQTSQTMIAGVIVCHPPELIRGLVSGKFDVGLLRTIGRLPNISLHRLFDDRLTFISGEQLPELVLKDIETWELFAPIKGFIAWQIIEEFFQKHKTWPRNILHVNHPLLVTQIVRNHPGVRGIVSESLIPGASTRDPRSPFPVTIKDMELPTLPTYAIWREGKRSRDIEKFVELLIQFVESRKPSPMNRSS